MSAAPECPPDVFIPDRARTHRPTVRHKRFTVVPSGRDGSAPVLDSAEADWSVTSWHRATVRQSGQPRRVEFVEPSATRLTRRGAAVLAAAAMIAACAIGGVAWASAPAGAGAPAAAPATVTVEPGDTLWSIAQTLAPNRDPRAEIDALARLNHVDGVALTPGQVLRTR